MNASVPVAATRWLVVYTKPRQEKKAAAELEKRGIGVYCPLKREKRKWSDRWKWVETPLFTSYVFVRTTEAERQEVLRVPAVVRFVYWLKQPAVVRDSEMETLQRWLNDYTGEALEVVGLEPGGRARIESGALMGRDGAVVERRGNRLVLFLESLDLEVQVDLRQTQITAADEPAPEEL
ncbi:MAG: UpxY family transcription antiterminator [Schleiferiaceae bacterium]|nr:UpxY family transcription antiterminator [Schleiferiaceae bacterium]